MFSLNGLINIKNILIVNIILSLLVSVILVFKIGNVSEINAYQTCRHIANSYQHAATDGVTYNYSICKNSGFFYYDEINKKYRSKKQITKKVFFFELDNLTYVYNFFLLTNAEYMLSDLKAKVEQYNIEKNIFEFQNHSTLKNIIEDSKMVRNRSVIEPLSDIYSSLFSNNDFNYFFLNFINFLYLLITFFLFYIILKKIFKIKDKKILFLISANICFFPLFLMYFLTFYKEPVILIGLFIILANFFYFYNGKKKLFEFLIFAFLINLAIDIISIYKTIYVPIIIATFIISNFFIFFSINKLKDKVNVIIQLLVVFSLVFNLHQVVNAKFTNEFVEIKNIFENITESSKKKTNKNNLDYKKNYKQDQISKMDSIDIVNNKLKLQNIIQQSQGHLISDPMPEKIIGYHTLNCFFIHHLYCKRFNNLIFRIVSIKNDTSKENRSNANAINIREYKGTKDVLLSLPAALKGYVMPLKIRLNFMVIFLTAFKLFITIILIIALYKLFLIKKTKLIKKILLGAIIFSPFLIIIDLVTSNFFTYYRYVFPFNVYIILVIYGSLATYFLNEKNQYNNKFR